MEKVRRGTGAGVRMKQTLRDMAWARKCAGQERLLSLLGYDVVSKRTRAGNGTEFEEELRN